MTQQKDMVKDAFLNDEAYFKQEEKMITETRYKYLRSKDRSIF